MPKLKTVISSIFSTSVVFTVLMIQAKSDDFDEMSPFKDRRIPKSLSSPYSDRDPITGERIYNLDPYEVRPMITDTERFIDTMRENSDQFKTLKRWKSETKKESSFDSVLSPDFLPSLALSKVQIARMRAKDLKMEKQLRLMGTIIDTNSSNGGKYGEEMTQQRFEILKMKRESIDFYFEDAW
jgi:hypothetical protein